MSFYDDFSPLKFRDRANHNSFVNDLRKELENDRKMFEGNFGNFFSPNIQTGRRGGNLRSRMGQDFFKNFDGPHAGSSASASGSSGASTSSSESPGAGAGSGSGSSGSGERVIPIHVLTEDNEDAPMRSNSRPTSSASNPVTARDAHDGNSSSEDRMSGADNQKSYSTQRNNTTEMPRVKEISRGQRAQSAPPASAVNMTECGGGHSKAKNTGGSSGFRNIPIQVESGQSAGRSQQQQQQQQHPTSSSKGSSCFGNTSSGSGSGSGSGGSDQESKPTPAKKPTLILDPLAKISAVAEQVTELAQKVVEFNASNSHKEYLFLDEMLTRCLIQLDDVVVEGKDDVRQARRECIKSIQKCISDLEIKAQSNSASNSGKPSTADVDADQQNGNQTTDDASLQNQTATGTGTGTGDKVDNETGPGTGTGPSSIHQEAVAEKGAEAMIVEETSNSNLPESQTSGTSLPPNTSTTTTATVTATNTAPPPSELTSKTGGGVAESEKMETG